jgi:hypothetical protein
MKWFSKRAAHAMIVAGALVAVTGCGGPGTVSGKVTLNGTPLPGGLVTIIDSEGQSRLGRITKEGTYSMSNVAPGMAQVSVFTSEFGGGVRVKGDPPRDPYGPYVKIPGKYADIKTSGLTIDIKGGKQEYDIPMTGDVDAPAAPQ